MAEVVLRGVNKSFGVGKKSVPAVIDMDLQIPDGSFVVLLGPCHAQRCHGVSTILFISTFKRSR